MALPAAPIAQPSRVRHRYRTGGSASTPDQAATPAWPSGSRGRRGDHRDRAAGRGAACGAAPSGQAGGPDAGTAAVAATPATPAATARGRPPATPGGSIAVDIDVTPGYVAVGAVTLSLALEPARNMFDQAAALNADPVQQGQDTAKAQNGRSFILAGGMTRVTNNLDPSQAA